MPELKPIAWATVYTRAGNEDRIEIGDANPVRECNAELWGWQHRRVPLVEIPADQVLVPIELLKRLQDHIEYDAIGSPSASIASDLADELRTLLQS